MAAKGGYRVGAGRKKGFAALEAEKAREYICSRVIENLEPMVDKALEQALEGDRYAREWLAERAFGKTRATIDITNTELPAPILGGLTQEIPEVGDLVFID